MHLWKTTLKALGKRGSALLCIGSLGGLILSSVDIGLTVVLQALLLKLGLQETPAAHDPALPLGLSLSTPLLAFALVSVGVARGAGLFLVRYSASCAQNITMTRLRLIRFYRSLHQKDASPFSPAETQHAHHEIYPKTAAYLYSLAQGISIFIYASCLLAAMIFNAPWPTLYAVLGLFVLGPVFAKIHRRIRQSALSVPKAHEALMRNIDRLSQNWLYLRLMRLMAQENERLARHTLAFHHSTLRISFWQLSAQAALTVAGVLLLVGILIAGIQLEVVGGVRTVAFVYLFIRFAQALATLLNSWGGVIANSPQFAHCGAELSTVSSEEIHKAVASVSAFPKHSAPTPKDPPAQSAPPTMAPPPHITIEDLSFRFSQKQAPLFLNMSFEVQPGQFCALVGPSGSGKTTLIALLAGILEPSSGSIMVDEDPAPIYYEKRVARVGFVGASSYLVQGSLRENLSLGVSPTPTDQEIFHALRAAQIDVRVSQCPNELDHLLLPGGEGFSSGEKQRLCLARALLSRPQILFLDEVSAKGRYEDDLLTFHLSCC